MRKNKVMPTAHEAPPLAPLEDQPGYYIRRLQQIAVALFLEETQAQGITPDIVLPDVQLVQEDHGPQIIESEATLSGHLEATEPDAAADAQRDPELDTDYALSAALNALKAMVVARRQGGVARG